MMVKMNVVLSLAVLCLAVNNGIGAPTTARYMFMKCNPHDKEANCQTYSSPVIDLTSDLPARLPASAAEFLNPNPVDEEEQPINGEGEDHSVIETKWFNPEEGSSFLEGSAVEPSFPDDRVFAKVEPESGSGADLPEYEMTELYQGMRGNVRDGPAPPRSPFGEGRPPAHELREDHLL